MVDTDDNILDLEEPEVEVVEEDDLAVPDVVEEDLEVPEEVPEVEDDLDDDDDDSLVLEELLPDLLLKLSTEPDLLPEEALLSELLLLLSGSNIPGIYEPAMVDTMSVEVDILRTLCRY